jgi:hypothetical protein
MTAPNLSVRWGRRCGADHPAAAASRTRTLALLLELASLAAAVAGCGGDDDAGAGQTTTQTSSTATSSGGQGWEQIVPGAECRAQMGQSSARRLFHPMTSVSES